MGGGWHEGRRRARHSGARRLLDDLVLDEADVLDLDAHHITHREEAWWIHGHTDAGWRAGADDVTRLQRADRREDLDQAAAVGLYGTAIRNLTTPSGSRPSVVRAES